MPRLPQLQSARRRSHSSRSYHPRTLALLATPAVVGAMTVAMPALAGTSLLGAPTAHKASSSRCITAIVHRRHVRECLVPGPRGPRGFTGVPGPRGLKGSTGAKGSRGSTGLKGATGAIGLTGPQGVPGHDGANGSARAYAVVKTQPTLEVISAQSFNITAITSPTGGVYCLTPAAPINPSADTAVVSPEISYSTPEAPGLVALNAQRKNCAAGTFEVDTYAPATSTLSNSYAFSIIIA